jgi:hypothetical protein
MRTEPKKTKTRIASLLDLTEPDDYADIIEEIPLQKKTEILKGELTKPDPIKKEIKRLDKVVEKTDRLLKKHSDRVARATAKSSKAVATPSPKRSQIKRRASHMEYMCLKGIKKAVLENIKKNSFKDEGTWKSIIDTEEIKEKINKTSNLIRDAIYRMKEEEWYEVIHSSQSGRRIVEINPNHYGIKEHDA